MRLLPIPLLFVACVAFGQDVPPPPALQPVPAGAPDAPNQGDEFEPEVTIIRRQGTTVEEYRTNGRLYMVRVTPDVGVPYYLVDVDGDGTLESRFHEDDDFDRVQAVPGWVIFSW